MTNRRCGGIVKLEDLPPELQKDIEKTFDAARERMVKFFLDLEYSFEDIDEAEAAFEQQIGNLKSFDRSPIAKRMFMFGYLVRHYE